MTAALGSLFDRIISAIVGASVALTVYAIASRGSSCATLEIQPPLAPTTVWSVSILPESP